MASDTLAPPPPRTVPRLWADAYILLIALTMALTGWIALNEGWHRYLPSLRADPAQAYTAAQLQDLRADPDPAQLRPRLRAFSPELAGLSDATQPRRFLDSRLPEHGLYLAHMPRLNRLLLTGHIFLGVFCMLFGGLQFWPYLRRRHMTLHQLVGGVYVLTAPVSVLLSLVYLARTPPAHLYTQLTGFVALWIFGLGAIASIGLALRALRLRRIHEHMGWMALSFACLLVAPLLRLNWVFTAWLFPHIDQETLNLVTLSFMLPQCLLIGFGLMSANRQPQPRRRSASPFAQSTQALILRGARLWWLLAVAAVCTVGLHVGAGHGLADPDGARSLMPHALAAREAAAWQGTPALGWGFTLATGMALLAGLSQLLDSLRDASPRVLRGWHAGSITVVAGAVLAGAISLLVGWRIGLAPGMVWLTGGSFYTVEGLLLVGLAGLHARRLHTGSIGLARESLVLLLSVLPAPAIASVALRALAALPWSAGDALGGHVYLLGTAGASGLLCLALPYAVLGQANREHA